MDSVGELWSRRSVLATCCAFAFSTRTAKAEPAFRFGLTPVFLLNDLELLRLLDSYLARRTGGTVELVMKRTYQEITALLVSGQLHGAWICGYPYVRYCTDLDLAAVPVWRGKPLYQSYLITSVDRRTESWRDLAGDIHAFSDPDSNSGYLVTRALLASAGLTENGFFPRSFFTYGHRNVIRAVASGLAGSGSVDGYVYEVLKETESALVAQTRVVRASEWLGFPPVATPRLLRDDSRTSALRKALVSMADDEEGRMILSLLRLDGFAVADPSLYDPIGAKLALVETSG